MIKKILKFTLMGLGTLVVLGIVIAACSGDKKEAGEVTKGTVENEATAKIGDHVKVGDWQYTILSAKEQKTVKGLFSQEKPDVDKFVVVKVKFENIGKDKSTLDSSLLKLIDDEGAEYTATSKIHNDTFLKPVNPHGKVTADIAFDVPNKKIDTFKVEASGGMISSDTADILLKK